jgi:hypothetical protein
MKIEKIANWSGRGYDFKLIKDKKVLTILYARVLDLYFMLEDGERIKFGESKKIDFDIGIEDGKIYNLFDNLYNDVIAGNIFDEKDSIDNYLLFNYNRLVDTNKNINWVSDDGLLDEEDMMSISKNDNSYKLTFIRNNKRRSYGFKDPCSIIIRLSNSGSRYDPFNIIFMRMYQSLQNIDEKDIEKNNSKVKRRIKE